MIEQTQRTKIATFYLDKKDDIKAYEDILNNEMCEILSETQHKVRESNKEYSGGEIISENSFERIYLVVRYVITTIEKPKK